MMKDIRNRISVPLYAFSATAQYADIYSDYEVRITLISTVRSTMFEIQEGIIKDVAVQFK